MNIKNNVLSIVLLLCFLAACQQGSNDKKQVTADQKPVEKKIDSLKPTFAVSEVLSSFNVFWNYYSRYVKLYEDFVPYDTAGKVIDKQVFLNEMLGEKYFPLLLGANDSKWHYRLTPIPATADPNAGSYMRQFAADELKYSKMKGKPIPAFSFKDINGKLYTSANTKGKIVLFKCWFIGCVTCVEEMPALNELVKKYKDRNDILFVSLAIDSKPELQAFLAKTQFDYATVPNQEGYMNNKLLVNAYPTHFLINKEGVLVNVVSDEASIASLLDREADKN